MSEAVPESLAQRLASQAERRSAALGGDSPSDPGGARVRANADAMFALAAPVLQAGLKPEQLQVCSVVVYPDDDQVAAIVVAADGVPILVQDNPTAPPQRAVVNADAWYQASLRYENQMAEKGFEANATKARAGNPYPFFFSLARLHPLSGRLICGWPREWLRVDRGLPAAGGLVRAAEEAWPEVADMATAVAAAVAGPPAVETLADVVERAYSPISWECLAWAHVAAQRGVRPHPQVAVGSVAEPGRRRVEVRFDGRDMVRFWLKPFTVPVASALQIKPYGWASARPGRVLELDGEGIPYNLDPAWWQTIETHRAAFGYPQGDGCPGCFSRPVVEWGRPHPGRDELCGDCRAGAAEEPAETGRLALPAGEVPQVVPSAVSGRWFRRRS